MRSKTILRWLLGFVLVSPVACDTESSDLLTDLSDVFIPNFSNQWTAIKGKLVPSYFFFFVDSVDSSKGTGTINVSNQRYDDVNSNQFFYHFNGSFDNSKVNIHFLTNAENGGDNGPEQGLNYKGIFDTLSNPITIRLLNTTNSGDSLVIEQR